MSTDLKMKKVRRHQNLLYNHFSCLSVFIESSSVTTLTGDGGMNVLFLNQQVSGALWEPGQHQQLDEGWYHHHREKQGPVLVLQWGRHSQHQIAVSSLH